MSVKMPAKTAFCLAVMLLILMPVAKAATTPERFYNYANNNAEYSVALPEAPTVESIWADRADGVPYLDTPLPKDAGVVGEIASFRRVDDATEDFFDVKIFFLKADEDFLKTLTKDKMQEAIEKDYSAMKLDDKKFNFSEGTSGLKWLTMTGFSVDPKNNRPFYHAAHYLTGRQSIMVIRAEYSFENEIYAGYYDKMVENITYHAQ